MIWHCVKRNFRRAHAEDERGRMGERKSKWERHRQTAMQTVEGMEEG